MRNKKKKMLVLALFVICLLAVSEPVSAKKYYSLNELGVSKNSAIPCYEMRSWKGNTIEYRKYDTSHGSDYPVIGKWKNAKITNKTKYYVGDLNHFYKVVSKYNGNYDLHKIKYAKKTTKVKFKKYYRKSSFVWVNLVIKKGKVKKVIYKCQVSG